MMKRPLTFHETVAVGDLESLRKLMIKGDEVNQIVKYGNYTYSPLMIAVKYGRLDMVRELLARGAKTSTQGGDSKDTALMMVVNYNYVKVQEELKDSLLPMPVVSMNYEVLTAIVRELLSAEEVEKSVNIQNHQGITALMIAAKKGYLDIVNLLLSHGAMFTLATKVNYLAIDYALQKAHLNVICRLLDAGDEMEKKTEGDDSLLMKVSYYIKDIENSDSSTEVDTDADADDVSESCQNDMDSASHTGNAEVEQKALVHTSHNSVDNYFNIVKELFYRGAEVEMIYQDLSIRFKYLDTCQRKFFEMTKECKKERSDYLLVRQEVESIFLGGEQATPQRPACYQPKLFKDLVGLIVEYASPSVIKKLK